MLAVALRQIEGWGFRKEKRQSTETLGGKWPRSRVMVMLTVEMSQSQNGFLEVRTNKILGQFDIGQGK